MKHVVTVGECACAGTCVRGLMVTGRSFTIRKVLSGVVLEVRLVSAWELGTKPRILIDRKSVV